ncbi:aromatic ring-hydroxylating oxygenase subunit alpha [Niveispirillum fermenti]|uniref:aromatic ring-hydroxylating oxygenase subunit alpha n=1 Tax=Niveispirillum fermenti TaxID=1233113 RepID=UPI003A837F56
MDTILHPDVMDGGTSAQLRGDPITGDRYWSPAFMEAEWDHMWTRIWHIGAREAELEEPGDFVVHRFRHEAVVLVRQEDGSIRAFYNVCRHRGNRLVVSEAGSVPAFTCAYHGWRWGLDGVLQAAQDPENFAKGNPCGKLRLKEVPCATWGGFVWYSMDPDAKPLLDYLDPLPALLANREMEKMVRVVWRKVEVETNWKFASDNFNESYHLPTVHPQMVQMIDEDYKATIFEMYPSGHNRMIELGQPSMRAEHPNEVEPIWEMMLRAWDLDPADFKGRSRDGRQALQQRKREVGASRGHTYLEKLSDAELTDYFHHTLFPNITITGTPVDGSVHIFRTEPHISDPNKCTFEYWGLVPRIEGVESVNTVCGPRPLREAELEHLVYGRDDVGDFIDQDLSVAVQQQKGLRSRGYDDAYLSEQEARVRRFHEVLNDYLEGRR